VLRKRLNYPDLKRAVLEQAQAHRATAVLIEDRASGTQLIQDLVAQGLSVKGIAPEHDKVMRLHAQSAAIENGFVFIPKEAPWLAEYLHELTIFPNSKHDDQTDSTSQFLAWINLTRPEPGIIGYYRFEAARERVEEGMTIEEAAARAGVTVESLKEWIDPNKPNPLIEEYERTVNALRG
jgi:predicted phage terminase large subunit-like protein